MSNAIEIKGLTKKYDGFILDDINLTLPSGAIMGFIGENGAGKSTTIKLILDLIRKDSGKISVLGSDFNNNAKKLKENIGVVLEESGFPETLTLKNINTVLKNCYETWDEKKFINFADRFSLPLKKEIKSYSKGMRMKLAIAAALSHDSRLLILDEATSGLDPVVRDEILDVFLDFVHDETHSIFISSHIISDLEKICDYITFIHNGKILFSDPKDILLSKYAVIKCSDEDFSALDKSTVIGFRKNADGVQVLAHKDRIKEGMTADAASIEDIMLFYIKGNGGYYEGSFN